MSWREDDRVAEARKVIELLETENDNVIRVVFELTEIGFDADYYREYTFAQLNGLFKALVENMTTEGAYISETVFHNMYFQRGLTRLFKKMLFWQKKYDDEFKTERQKQTNNYMLANVFNGEYTAKNDVALPDYITAGKATNPKDVIFTPTLVDKKSSLHTKTGFLQLVEQGTSYLNQEGATIINTSERKLLEAVKLANKQLEEKPEESTLKRVRVAASFTDTCIFF